MKRNSTLFTLCLLLVTSGVSLSQLKDYNYLRPINGVEDTWHNIELPDDIYDKISSKLSDIRVVRINDGDTLETPYLVKTPIEGRKNIDFEVLNKTRKGDVFYYTFKVGPEKTVDRIKLDFLRDNFDLKISLQGSQDQKEWFNIVEDYRILSIKNALTDYQFTNIRFSKSQFQYFRLVVPTSIDPNFQSAGISEQLVSDQKLRLYRPIRIATSENRENKQTILTGDLELLVPVSTLKISVNESIDYYRPVTIQYLSDSFNTEKGWKYNYKSVYKGTLSSLDNNEFSFPAVIGQRFKVIIENYDNQPLDIVGFDAVGKVNELIVRFDQPKSGNHYLLFGNSKAIIPNYDIKNFQSNIPEKLASVALGAITPIEHKVESVNPLFESELWLWVVMIVVIALLGWFSIKMMKGK